MTERAQKIMDAYGKVLEKSVWYNEECVVAVLRAVVEELKYIGITEKNILELVNELETPDQLAQENPQVPLDAL